MPFEWVDDRAVYISEREERAALAALARIEGRGLSEKHLAVLGRRAQAAIEGLVRLALSAHTTHRDVLRAQAAVRGAVDRVLRESHELRTGERVEPP